jgi:copper resistance protein C
MTSGRILPALTLALSIICLGPSGAALAHATLVSSVPAADAMAMPPPNELRLKFSEAIEPNFTKIILTGPDGAIVKTGPGKLEESDDSLLIVPLAAPLPDGQYKVNWQAVAKDGHKTKGSYSFTSMQ